MAHEEIFRPDNSNQASRSTSRGELRRIAHGLYTWNLDEPLEQLVRRRWLDVTGIYFPDAVIVDRSAILARPAKDGSLFLDAGPSYTTKRQIVLPGLTLKPRSGLGPLPDDTPYGPVFQSSQARAALENMRSSRARSGVSRTLSRAEMEEWIGRLMEVHGEKAAHVLRDNVRKLAVKTGQEPLGRKFDSVVASMLGTGHDHPVTRVGRARRRRTPFDTHRLLLFNVLRDTLMAYEPADLPAFKDPNRVFGFFEAYFSNFIEGTEFEVDEAAKIIFGGKMPSERPQDAHDILGTFNLVTNPKMSARTPSSAEDLLDLLGRFNHGILSSRSDKNPGKFKVLANRAGGTSFVAPELVAGTLREGWSFYETLTPGFRRGVFAMFLVTEVHPFADGNGRTARALLSAELSANAQTRFLVPLSFRIDYLSALRAMSHSANPTPLIRMVERAMRWSKTVDWSDLATAIAQLEATNALAASTDQIDGGILRDPPAKATEI